MIKFFNAGAGSGKTYTLAHELAEFLITGDGKPSEVILTTFSNKSADELKERVRKRLIKRGEFEKAQSMANASIGTINAVCSRFVEQFALEVGISPQLRVLDETGADRFFDEFVQIAVDPGQVTELDKLSARFSLFSSQHTSHGKNNLKTLWPQFAKNLAIRFRAYRFDMEAMQRSREETILMAREFLHTDEGFSIERIWEQIHASKQSVTEGSPTQKDTSNLEALKELQKKSEKRVLREYAEFSGMTASPGVNFGRQNPWYTELCALVSTYHRTVEFAEDYTRLIYLLYDTAFQMIDAYQQYKAERGLIDFADQEILFLKMLRENEIVRNEISNSYRLVMVDEFQDSSPVQLAIFSELSMLVNDSLWVGDPKQAIYGFRDSDSQLFELAMQSVDRDPVNKRYNLDTSYRSRPGLVHAVNEMFKGIFNNFLKDEQIVLKPCKDALNREKSYSSAPLELLEFPKMNNECKFGAVGIYVRELLESGRQIWDKELCRMRVIRGGDIAILFRSNSHLSQAAEMLGSLGIQVAAPSSGLSSRAEVLWITSLIRLRINPRDSLAAANLMLLEDTVDNVEEIITMRLQHLENETGNLTWAAHSSAARVVLEQAEALDQMPLSLAITHLISATSLPAYCARWGDEGKRMAVVNEVIAQAAEFEEQSAIAGIAASMQGFLNSLLSCEDVPADQSVDAVVLMTVHKAKGLEWPVVFAMNKLNDSGYCRTLFNTIHVSHPQDIGLSNLLSGQKIIFLPWPFALKKSLAGVSQDLDIRAGELDLRLGSGLRNQKEEDRLLYVALTRARDHIVLPIFNGETFCELESNSRGGITGFLNAEELNSWLGGKEEKSLREKSPGITARVIKRPALSAVDLANLMANVHQNEKAGTVEIYRSAVCTPTAYDLKYISPSSLNMDGSGVLIKLLGYKQEMIHVNNLSVDQYANLGTCVHNVITSWQASQPQAVRLKKIAGLIEGYGMAAYLSLEELDRRCAVFSSFIQDTYKPQAMFHELPLTSMCPDSGQVVSGIADLVLQTDKGLVLIDHKSFPGHFESMAMNPQSEFYAGKYSGQLDAYAKVLTQSFGQPIVGKLVHYVVQGTIVEILN
ncbi:UvrD-helicase domain-containing protein [Flavitalea sp.]|nr:UvrD-helicase domain-containing protein [Flavitalea sp.]